MSTDRLVQCPRRPHARFDRGFSLVELLVASAVALCLLAALLGATADAQRSALTQPEVADLEQRLRTATAALVTDLERAGAGTPLGCAPGPLHRHLAPVRPHRIGLRGAQPPGTVDPRTLSVISSPADAHLAVLASPLVSAVATVAIGPCAGAHSASPTLGFEDGMSVAVIDPDGVTDLFQITAAQPGALDLALMAGAMNGTHASGACIVEVEVASYTTAPDASTGALTLTRYDGFRSELPVVDHLVDLRFAYFGEPRAPRLIKDAGEPSGPWTTYGPRPPPVGTDNPRDVWPAGESCLFAGGGPPQPPRLTELGIATGGLVELDAASLADGPWCPDVGSPSGYDADLLRIRRVAVVIRVQVPTPFLRGPVGPLFGRGGSSTGGTLFVPDRSATLDITLRNMGVDR